MYIFHTGPNHSVFRINRDAQGGSGMTQFGRARAELNIEIICTNSSQGKAQSHRMLQDRLVSIRVPPQEMEELAFGAWRNGSNWWEGRSRFTQCLRQGPKLMSGFQCRLAECAARGMKGTLKA